MDLPVFALGDLLGLQYLVECDVQCAVLSRRSLENSSDCTEALSRRVHRRIGLGYCWWGSRPHGEFRIFGPASLLLWFG
jgi:hypothetical protein